MDAADNQHPPDILRLPHHYDGSGRGQHLQRYDIPGTEFLAQPEADLIAPPHHIDYAIRLVISSPSQDRCPWRPASVAATGPARPLRQGPLR